ncbi:MAG: hypothetical protein R2883_03985 [Caldisericia bacterium]
MQKHLDNVKIRIKSNPWQFALVFLIVLLLSSLFHTFVLSIRFLAPIQFGTIIPNVEFLVSAGLFLSYGSITEYLLLCLAVVLSIAVGSFLIAGYLSCLEIKETFEKSKNWFQIFFSEGVKRFSNVFIVSIINYLILYLLTMLLSFAITFIVVDTVFGSSSFGSLVFIFLIVVLFIVLSIFFVFIPYEAVFSKKSTGFIVSSALKKASKVFGSLTLVTFLTWLVYILIYWLFIRTVIYTTQYIAVQFFFVSFFGFLLAVSAMTFFYFPLYKKASVIIDAAEPVTFIEETTAESESIHKTEYIGSHNNVFHKTNCWHVEQILPGTEVYFESREEAIEKGFEPCKHCNP